MKNTDIELAEFDSQLKSVKNVQKGSISDLKKLLSKYDPLIRSLSYRAEISNTALTFEDMHSILTAKFWELTKNFDQKKGKHFASYIKEFLTFETSNRIRAFTSNKHKAMNEQVEFLDNSEQEEIPKLMLEDFVNLRKNNFSEEEWNYINLIKQNKSNNEIVELMNKNKVSVYSIRKRVVNKLKKNIS